MLNNLLYKLDIILPALAFIISGTGLIRKKAFFFPDLVLFLFFIIQLFLNSVCAFFQQLATNNQPVYHINCLLTQALFTYYFSRAVKRKWLVFAGMAVFLAAYVFITLYVQPFSVFPSYAYGLGCGIIAAYSLLLLTDIINNLPATNILELKEFWIIAGVLTYFGSSFFIFITYDYLSGLIKGKVSILWQFHNIFLSFGCLVFLNAINSKKWILKSS